MMQNSVNQQESDQGHSMGDSTAITIEFLRARLLTERSVSKAAKQRSDELAKRVLELEEQLKLVSLQRKKAEKAVTDVLSILESNGVSDFLEEFDSGSELDETLSKSKINNNLSKEEECSVCPKTLNDDSDGSEDVASPLSSRSLSWKSCRASSTSHEKSIDSSTRKRGKGHYRPVVASSSRRRVGKSRRQTQRKEIRSAAVDDSQINGNMSCPEGYGAAICSDGCLLNCEIESDNYREELDKQEMQISPANLQRQEHAPKGIYENGHESSKGMEKALKYQEQFIGKYEEEEKAQREWEEKFRENNNSIPNSDVSEENAKMKESGKCKNGAIRDESQVSEHSERQDNQTNKDLNSLADSSKPHAIVPHASTSTSELGSVLGALNEAKLSLQHKCNMLSSNQMNLRRRPIDFRSQIPTIGGLLRVPSELEYGMRTNLDSQPRLTNTGYDSFLYGKFVLNGSSTGGYNHHLMAETTISSNNELPFEFQTDNSRYRYPYNGALSSMYYPPNNQ